MFGMDWCEARLAKCIVGGMGPVAWERAGGGIMLSGHSNVLLQDCVVHHSGALEENQFPGTMGTGISSVQVCVKFRVS
jgi:hypothetical protein